ncbi:hypothetical protein JYB64_24795, partial [Algoriphagus aestuarii]|nr:hypothetical protein [Algoriphagus aestuarii]
SVGNELLLYRDTVPRALRLRDRLSTLSSHAFSSLPRPLGHALAQAVTRSQRLGRRPAPTTAALTAARESLATAGDLGPARVTEYDHAQEEELRRDQVLRA